MFDKSTTQFNLKTKISIFILIVVGFLVFFTSNSYSAEYWVSDPLECPDAYGGVTCKSGDDFARVCGLNGVEGRCWSNMTWITAPTATRTGQVYKQIENISGRPRTGGYVLDCYAVENNPSELNPVCDNGSTPTTSPSTLWCNEDASCYGQYRNTTCEGGWATTTLGSFSCGACKTNRWDCTGTGSCTTTVNSNCDYDLGGGQFVSGTIQCSVGSGSCTNYGGSSADCSCVPSSQNFVTGIQALSGTSNPLLWGKQYGDGDLIRFTNNKVSTSSFVVFNSGQVAIGHNINVSTTSVAFEVSSTNRGILIPRLATNPTNGVDGELYYDSVDKKFKYFNGSAWSDLGGGSSWATTTLLSVSGNATGLYPVGTVSTTIGIGSTGADLWLQTSSTPRIYVAENGNVGIGTVTPTEKLSVVGNISNLITSQSGIRKISSVNVGAFSSDIHVSGKYAYVTNRNSNSISIVDISNPSTPIQISTASVGSRPSAIYVSNKYAYVTNQDSNSISVVDISNPSVPVQISATSVESYPNDIHVSGKYAYVTNQDSNSISVVDISNPYSPIQISTTSVGYNPRSIYISGKYAYIIKNEASANISVVDISNPYLPTQIYSGDIDPYPESIYVSGNYAYTVNAFGSISIININNPYLPVQISTTSVGTSPVSVYVSGKYAYVTNYASDFVSVVDISSPSSPIQVSTTSVGYNMRAIYVSGRYAYATHYNAVGSVSVIDLTGTEVSSLIAHSAEVGNLQIGNDLSAKGTADFGSLSIGIGGIISNGPISVMATNSPSYFGGNVGIGTTSPVFKLSLGDDGGIYSASPNYIPSGLYGGEPLSGAVLPNSSGTLMFWYPRKAAFRAGVIAPTMFNGDAWNDESIGISSAVFGINNMASGTASFVGGGVFNTAQGASSFIGGGRYNTTTDNGYYSFIGNGRYNEISGSDSFIGGGFLNKVIGNYSIAFGYGMTVSGTNSFGINVSTTPAVLGQNNTIALMGGNVGIGTTTPLAKLSLDNDGSILAQGTYGSGWKGGSLGVGSRMMWIASRSAFRAGYVNGTSWDESNIAPFSTAFGNSNLAAEEATFIGGGAFNKALGQGSSIIGGNSNTSSGIYSFVGGGRSNNVSGYTSAVFGFENNISGEKSFIGGGDNNTIIGTSSFIGGGLNNYISGENSFIGGGSTNMITSSNSFIGGGFQNFIFGDNSIAFGRNMIVKGNNSFGVNLASVAQATLIDPNTLAIMGGNVGIGTVSPDSRLSLSDTGENLLSLTTAQTLAANVTTSLVFKTSNAYTAAIRSIGTGVSSARLGFFTGAAPSGVSSNERITIVNQGNVGINTTSPGTKLTVDGTFSVAGGVSQFLDYVGIGTTSPLSALHISSNNTSESNYGSNLIIQNLASGSDAEAATMFRTGSTPPGQYWWAGVNGGSGFSIALGSVFRGSSTTIHMTPELDVGIGTTEPSTKLHVVGGARITGLGGATDYYYVCIRTDGTLARGASCAGSDSRFKKDIVNISTEKNVLEMLSQIRGVYHYWDNTTYSDSEGRRQIGVIAQEIEVVLPEVVSEDVSTTYKFVDYPKLTAFLIEVAKAQQAEIEALRETVSATLNIQQVSGQLVYENGDLDLQNYALLNVKNIVSADNKWAIDENGQFITRIQTSGGNTKEMFAMQSPYSEFVFSSSSELINGEAIINFDSDTCELIDETQPLKVNITLTGECGGIFVKEKSATGFVVKELNGGTSTSTFDWMVIAKRKFATTSPQSLPTGQAGSPSQGEEGVPSPLEGEGQDEVEIPSTLEGEGEVVTTTPPAEAEPLTEQISGDGEPTTTPEVLPEPPIEEPPVEAEPLTEQSSGDGEPTPPAEEPTPPAEEETP